MKTVDTALKVLQLFQTEEQTLSVTEISVRMDLAKSKISRILASFRSNGFLDQDSVTKRYRVGLAAFELGAHYVKAQPIAHEALPVMRAIVERSQHSSTLTVMRNDLALHILAVEGPFFIDGRWRVGSRLPFHATSAGKILLGGMPEPVLDAFLKRHKLRAITKKTITDPAVLRKQLERIRKDGVCISRGESAPGLVAIAVPVLDKSNATCAALGIIIIDQMFDADEVGPLTALLHESARRLSIRLGASAYPFGDTVSTPPRQEVIRTLKHVRPTAG
jgi:IclR family acetate operon transcriptional repressor